MRKEEYPFCCILVFFLLQQIWHVLFLVFIIVVDIRVSQSAMSAAVDVITEWYDVFVT